MFNKPSYLSLLALSTLLPVAQAATPSDKQIVNWLTNKDKIVAEEVTNKSVHIVQTEAITLQSGEQAYLSAVEYADSGRNFSNGYILTRPQLKQSQHLEDFAGQSSSIEVLSRQRKATLLELESSGSGQGTVATGVSLVTFNGWKPVVHYRSESYDDFGYASETRGCTSIEAKLKFHDGNPAKVTETIKTLHQKNCDNPKTAKTKTTTKSKTITW
ncbi:hypothetical protein LVJ82_04055 [Vitreoscilla massiliensis]|uniref:Uncharacterized protein n=1 Tax=Vitreoscilla massiliensis TaxID=1689272 RepID=A0ABY4E465_9NEIS|nr:hypothetical protein [Vitreoscilla massiliensis]UOO90171.1 hypothetical protein LVJ82_04055 [Vitreoscilla massiliensis]